MLRSMPQRTAGAIVSKFGSAVQRCLLFGYFLATTTHAAEGVADVITESKLFGFGKVMYIADDKKGGRADQHTPGFGGKLGLETGRLSGLQFKAAWYTTQDFGLRSNNPHQTDAYLFALNKEPYSLWGEAQLIATQGNTQLIAGRQEVHSPLVNTYDYRIIPNLFEAITLINRDLPDTSITLAYIGKMSGLDGLTTFSQFRSMSEQAYTSLMVTSAGDIDSTNGNTLVPSKIVGDHGLWLTGIEIKNQHSLQLWNAYGTELINTLYAEGKLNWPLTKTMAFTLEAQAYRVSAIGRFKEYLSVFGLNSNYGLCGLKATLAHKKSGLSVWAAHNHFGGNDRTVTTFGNWGSYPEFVSMPYLFAEGGSVSAIARSRLTKIATLLDLEKYGLPGHSLLLSRAQTNLDEAIMPNSDIIVNGLLYRSTLTKHWSARVALESRKSRNTRYDNDFVTMALRYDF